MSLKQSWRTGLSFGLTSGVITTLGLMGGGHHHYPLYRRLGGTDLWLKNFFNLLSGMMFFVLSAGGGGLCYNAAPSVFC